MATCKYCSKEVTWMKEGKKNVPVEGDGTIHECDNYKASRKSIKVMGPGEVDPEILKQYEQSMNQQKVKKKK